MAKPIRDYERTDIDAIIEDYERARKKHLGIEHRYDGVLPIPSAFAGLTVAAGFAAVSTGSGPVENLKILAVGAMAFTVSFCVNKALFHTGSKLAATGNPLAIGLAAGWFSTLAAVFGTISFSGVSYGIVESINLRKPIAAIEQLTRDANEAVLVAQGVAPLIAAAEADKTSMARCEVSSGCISGRRGRGPTVGAMEALAGKSGSLRRLYAKAEKEAARLKKGLQEVAADYERQLNEGGVGSNRAELLRIYTRAQSLAAELRGAIPTQAARGLAAELRRVQVPPARRGRIDVAARLRAHADQIEQAISAIQVNATDMPPFPGPVGITSGWDHIDKTWPLAVLLFGLEGVLIMLFTLLTLDMKARIDTQTRRNNHDDDDPPSAAAVVTPNPNPPFPAEGRRASQLIGKANGAGQ